MNNDKTSVSRRAVLGSIGGIGLAAALGSAGTYALLSDSETSPTQAIQAGTLDLSFDGVASSSVSVSNVQSGSSGTSVFNLKNTGSIGGILGATVASVTDREGANPESETGNLTNPGELSKYVYAELGFVENGVKIPAVGPAPLKHMKNAFRQTCVLLDAGSSSGKLYVDWSVPDLNNDAQGDICEFDIEVLLEEVPVQPAADVVAGGSAYSTIQAAIDAANSGDVVEVVNGTYQETIVVDKPLTLRSRNGRGEVTIDGTGGSGELVSIRSSDVTVEGFTVKPRDGNQYGVIIKDDASNVTVRCNRFVAGSSSYASVTTQTNGSYSNLTFEHNVFESTGRRHMYLNPDGTDLSLLHNHFSGVSGPAVLESFENGTIANNVFVSDATPYWQFTVNGPGFTIEENLIRTSDDFDGIEDNGNNYSDSTLVADNHFFGNGDEVINV